MKWFMWHDCWRQQESGSNDSKVQCTEYSIYMLGSRGSIYFIICYKNTDFKLGSRLPRRNRKKNYMLTIFFSSQVTQIKWCGITREQTEALQWVRPFKHSSKSPSYTEAGLNTQIYFKAMSLQVSQILSYTFRLCFGFRKHHLPVCLYFTPATDKFQEFGSFHHLFLPPPKAVVSSVLFCINKTR